MKMTATSGACAAAVAALFTGACAAAAPDENTQSAEALVGIYEVIADRTNNADHEGAEFSVFRSQLEPETRYGLVFLQRQGKYGGGGFSCQVARYFPALRALSCAQVIGHGVSASDDVTPIGIETLTVGLPGSRFCSALGMRKNGPRKKVIVDTCEEASDDNKTYATCACYEIKLTCLGDSQAARNTACAGNQPAGDEGPAPPGSGAGSGGQH